jgi:tetratricopeptide (TPR) repeat protein
MQSGKVDQALDAYQRMKPDSPRVLHNMGLLYAEKKGDYVSAVKCYEKALKIEEKVT